MNDAAIVLTVNIAVGRVNLTPVGNYIFAHKMPRL